MMKRILMLFCVWFFAVQMSAYGENAPKEYADPLENPWIFTLEESWPGSEPIEGKGMTLKLKVPYKDTPKTVSELWQMDLSKGSSTHLVLHPTQYNRNDFSFLSVEPATYKTAVVVKGDIEVTFSNCGKPYAVRPKEIVHLMPGTPHQFTAIEDAVIMIYCYGEGIGLDKNRTYIKAYLDDTVTDKFTVFPKPEELDCRYGVTDRHMVSCHNFYGPNNEIRPSLARGYIWTKDFGESANRYLKVATYETEDIIEFVEFEMTDYIEYWPHAHQDVMELILITQEEATFWVGDGKENGQCDTTDPNYVKNNEEANSGRIGDGVRVKPGYVAYIPAGVPHTMGYTEYGNIWLGTSYPAGFLKRSLSVVPDKVYEPEKPES